MRRKHGIVLLFFMVFSVALSQNQSEQVQVEIEGSVKGKENYTAISGVEIRTDRGAYTTTNGLGEFKIKAAIGDLLIFESPDIETVKHRITSDEDIDVLVEGYSNSNRQENKVVAYRVFLDSAQHYKKTDIEKSIEFVIQAITVLGKGGNKADLANSYSVLGEVYQYHKQYDLAIDNYNYAQDQTKTVRTTLLLGETYVLNQNFEQASSVLTPLVALKGMVPYQRVQLYEFLGDAAKGRQETERAIDFYQESLKIAEKNQIAPKITDLNSKIAEIYALADRLQVAEGYFNNSLSLSEEQNPERAIQEKEKVADFYNSKRRFNDEIQLRKKSLKELEELPEKAVVDQKSVFRGDSITSQRINYKIASAYVAQDKLAEAIPYLEKSIVEADSEDDLVVQKDATRKLSEVYRNQGDFSKALETYQDYVAVVDSLYVRKEQEISLGSRLNREITTKQNRISSLEQERELSQSKYSLARTEQQLSEERNKRQQLVIYSLLGAMLLLALTAFFLYRSTKQQKLANNLLALKSLRTQMNPHFIFNALNSVNHYIAKSDERSANRFLSEFSVLMRTVLENSEEDFISLSKELELLQLYVKLEHSRFPEKFDFKINLEEGLDVDSFEIPPMLLQPYVENAIWHGLRYKEEKGFLHINFDQINEHTLQIEIADNGIGRKKSAALKTSNQKRQKSKGMGNIKRRIAILNEMYKNKVDVKISDLNDQGTGTKVVLQLKKD
ncbi:MAG: sensor histidine kinase [Allomuricauda sp.]|nr:MAG: sensor histidine kinase [Allomuricauda sp.]